VPSRAEATRAHRLTRETVDVRLALTNEELRSKNMTAKQWAARAVVAATMAAGLSACGGGGDSAAPAVAPAPEVLTAGLTIKESTDSSFQPFTFADLKFIDFGTDYDTPTDYGRYAQNNEAGGANHIELMVWYSKTTGLVSRATLVTDPLKAPFHAIGCGFDGYSCDNSRISVNTNSKEIRVSSLPLKSLTFTTTSGDFVISDSSTHLATNPGTVVVSGSVVLP